MEFSAEMIAGLIGGTVVGDPKAAVNNFARILYYIYKIAKILYIMKVINP